MTDRLTDICISKAAFAAENINANTTHHWNIINNTIVNNTILMTVMYAHILLNLI